MKNLRLVLALTLAGVLAPIGSAIALDIPRTSKADSRIRYATYDPDNVIQINSVLGLATMIELEPGENYIYHAYGDSKAYDFTVKHHYLFFKPRAEQADTNLMVLTDRRSYAFKIDYFEAPSKAVYKLTIRYPESEAAANEEAAAQRKIEQNLAAAQTAINWQHYTMSGDRALAPIHAWDDGRQTWLQFAPGIDLPAVYRVNADGQETVTNFHMAGARTMVLHHTAARWHLRQGNLVLAVHNEAYGHAPLPRQTGTITPAVERVVIGSQPAAPVLEDRPEEHIPAQAPASPSHPNTTRAVAMAIDTDAGIQVMENVPAGPIQTSDGRTLVQSTGGSQAAAPAAATQGLGDKSSPAGTAHAGPYVARDGDTTLMPTKITVSDGVTRMQFGQRDMPAVFMVDERGQDQFVGLVIEPKNTLAIQATAQRWKLVAGERTLILEEKEP